jgi:hypothetical protein
MSLQSYTLSGPEWLDELVVGLPNNSYKLITNTAWVCARFCKLQKRVHSTCSRQWGESFCWYWQNCWSSPIKLMLPSVVLMLAILLHVYYFVQIAYFFSVTIIIHWYQWIYIEPNPISKTKSIIFIYIEVVSVLIFNLKNMQQNSQH